MALFIVLIIVVVLTIVIQQLVVSTKIEKKISENRQGFLEISYTISSAARSAVQALETDLMEDLGLITDEEEDEDPTGGTGPGQGQGAGQGQGQGQGAGGGRDPERFDLRHEDWAHVSTETLNQVQIETRIISGEGCISLNHLFEYPQYPDELDSVEENAASGDPADPTGGGEADEDLEEEWEPPTPEQVEDATLIVSRLIQGLIATNEENGFEYLETPDADQAAGEIVNWVQQRIDNEETRLIRSMKPILALESVTAELFLGPRLPEDEDEDDEFRDEDSVLADLSEELGDVPGFEQLDDGVEEVPRPLGLRDVLTAHSSGKVNLNVARPEVYAALMLGFEDLDEAIEIALQIDEYLNLYQEEAEDDPGQPAATPSGDDEEDETDEFNRFESFDDLGEVDETWTEGDASDDNILDILRVDLEPVSAFNSTYFTVFVDGELDDRQLAGQLAVVRKERDLIAISWEETER